MSGQNHIKFSDLHLTINFALSNLHHNNTPVWAQTLIVEEFKVFWGQLYFCGLILIKAIASHWKSLKVSSSKFLIMHDFSIGKFVTR